MNLDVNVVFEHLVDSKAKIVCEQGGTRSGKTYNILMWIMFYYCTKNTDKIITICRKSYPALRASVMRDFFSILNAHQKYDESKHNKSNSEYHLFGNLVEFINLDQPQKVRGRKRDILYLNEGNEIPFTIFNQLVMRTSGKVLIDFNPSDTDHYLYETIEQDNATLIKSTYKDNVFLSQEQVDYIEGLISVDENFYRIYALGERPTSTTRIYSHFNQYDVEPQQFEDISYGLDFGFSHPTALIQVKYIGNKVYVKELLYQSGLTSQDMIVKFDEMGIDKSVSMYCDSARPEIIEELRRKGYHKSVAANKNVKPGIDRIKSLEVFVNKSSINLLKEYRNYNWKVVKDNITEEPVKLNDDVMDAMRYAIYSHMKSVKGIPFFIG